MASASIVAGAEGGDAISVLSGVIRGHQIYKTVWGVPKLTRARQCGVPALMRVSVRARHAQCVENRRVHAIPYTVYYIRYALNKQ